MVCSKCGKISPDGSRACVRCGNPLIVPSSKQFRNQTHPAAASSEQIIAVCRRHWTAYWGRILVAVLLFFYALQSIPYKNWPDVILSIVIIMLIVICTIFAYKNDRIELTESKITGHIGVIHTKTLTTPVSKVQNIGYANGLMGKIFRYHTVVIDNAGSGRTEFVFKHAAKAVPFVNAVQGRMG